MGYQKPREYTMCDIFPLEELSNFGLKMIAFPKLMALISCRSLLSCRSLDEAIVEFIKAWQNIRGRSGEIA